MCEPYDTLLDEDRAAVRASSPNMGRWGVAAFVLGLHEVYRSFGFVPLAADLHGVQATAKKALPQPILGSNLAFSCA